MSRTPASQPAASGSGTVAVDPRSATLTIAYSPEKAALIKSLADKFNAQNLRTPDGQRMQVELVELTPEEMVTQALAGRGLPGPDARLVALARPAEPALGAEPADRSRARSRPAWPASRCAMRSRRS